MPMNPPAPPSKTKAAQTFISRNAILLAFLAGQLTGIVLAVLLGGS